MDFEQLCQAVKRPDVTDQEIHNSYYQLAAKGGLSERQFHELADLLIRHRPQVAAMVGVGYLSRLRQAGLPIK